MTNRNVFNNCTISELMNVGVRNTFKDEMISTQYLFVHSECKLATSELREALGKPDINITYNKQ